MTNGELLTKLVVRAQNGNLEAFAVKVIELLSRPKLTDLPENPVGKVLELLQRDWEDFADIELDEVVDFAEASKTIGNDALYVERSELHRVDDSRILRYDLTLPLLLNVRYTGHPLKVRAAGKAYRLGRIDALHLEAFHQAEIFWLDERARLDPWRLGRRPPRSSAQKDPQCSKPQDHERYREPRILDGPAEQRVLGEGALDPHRGGEDKRADDAHHQREAYFQLPDQLGTLHRSYRAHTADAHDSTIEMSAGPRCPSNG